MYKVLIFLVVVFFFNGVSMAQLEWIDSIDGSTSGASIAGNSTTDSAGNTYTVGNFYSSISLDPNGNQTYYASNHWNVYIQKLDANGNFVWGKIIGGSGDERAGDISIDLQGDIFVTGTFEDTCDLDPSIDAFNVVSKGFGDVFIVKLSSNGDFVWGKSIGTTGYEFPGKTQLKPSGNYCISGEYGSAYIDLDPGPLPSGQSTSGTKGWFVTELTPSGDYVDGLALGTSDQLRLSCMSATPDNGLCLIGNFKGAMDMDPGPNLEYVSTPGNYVNSFLIRVDSSGDMIWYKSMTTPWTTMTFTGGQVEVSESGSIYVFDRYRDTLMIDANVTLTPSYAGGHGYLAKYSIDGSAVWGCSFDSQGLVPSELKEVQGEILLGGSFEGLIDLDPSNDNLEYTAGIYEKHGFIVCLDTIDGTYKWSQVFESELSGYVYFENLDVDAQGAIYTGGAYYGQVDFDPSPSSLVFLGIAQSRFIAKYNSTLHVEGFNKMDFTAYPNPTTGTIKLSAYNSEIFELTVQDAMGKVVYYRKNCSNNSVLDLESLEPGVYLLTANYGRRRAVKRIVLT